MAQGYVLETKITLEITSRDMTETKIMITVVYFSCRMIAVIVHL